MPFVLLNLALSCFFVRAIVGDAPDLDVDAFVNEKVSLVRRPPRKMWVDGVWHLVGGEPVIDSAFETGIDNVPIVAFEPLSPSGIVDVKSEGSHFLFTHIGAGGSRVRCA